MRINFKNVEIKVTDNKAYLTRVGSLESACGVPFAEVQLSGENKNTHLGAKMANSSEGSRLEYVSHTVTDTELVVVQRSPLVEVAVHFVSYPATNAVRAYTEVKNISDEDQYLEEVSALCCGDIGKHGLDSAKDLYFTRFTQSHHTECQPIRASFPEFGLYRGNDHSQKRIAFANIGSWSTKEELPQGIIEDTERGELVMFQIESSSSWYYEIADREKERYYLYLGGANLPFGGWVKKLAPGKTYRTVNVALAFGKTLNELLGNMNQYRRCISVREDVDRDIPAIFNEYMHLSWDSPAEERVRECAPTVAKTGVKYYVIDCGWHDEVPGNLIYAHVGKWRESNTRFPSGVKSTLDYIRSLGLKPGLWIEPEVIGYKCAEMLGFYSDDCFLQRNGKRLTVMERHFLDFRNSKVVEYMSETIRTMVEDYGAEYIKFDYNQDCGVGTDLYADSAADGLEQAADAYLCWASDMQKKYPHVLFETCSSGGMRMDYKTLSKFSIVSTSDQVDYRKYPYIAGNILSAVTPEQAAVWSYPVAPNFDRSLTAESVKELVSREQIIMNMINSFLGRMHLASNLPLLDDEKLELVNEGVRYYDKIRADKLISSPYLPMGFAHFGDKLVCAGFKTEKKLYLAVWNLGTDGAVTIPLCELTPKSVTVAYPSNNSVGVTLDGNELNVAFTERFQARMLEIELA